MRYYTLILILIFSCNKKQPDILHMLESKYNCSFVNDLRDIDNEYLFEVYLDTLSIDIRDFLKIDSTTNNLFEKYYVTDNFSKTKIILYYWHRKLNSKSFILEEHLKMVYSKKKEQEERDKERMKTARHNFNRFNIGDTVSIKFPVFEGKNNYRNAFIYENPNRIWNFEKDRDLRIEGIITNKHKSILYEFDIFLLKVNREDTYLFLKYPKLDDTLTISTAISPKSIHKL